MYPDLLGGVLSAVERQQLATVKFPLNHGLRFYKGDSPTARQFAALGRAGDSALQRRCQMLHLAASILSEYLPACDPDPVRGLSAKERFEQLFLAMPEGELRYRIPEELARSCGCRVRHFSRLFRERFGHSLTPKRTDLQLQKARELLVETNSKIIDVAMD